LLFSDLLVRLTAATSGSRHGVSARITGDTRLLARGQDAAPGRIHSSFDAA
jgi:hypothetical protein